MVFYAGGMDGAVDLPRLGAVLRGRREALGLTREELSQRTGLTGAYIWMVETAAPRKGRERTRPRRATLLRWLEALEMDQPEVNQALAYAGYAPTDGSPAMGMPIAPHIVLDAVAGEPVNAQRYAQRENLVRRFRRVLERSDRSDEEWQEAVNVLTTLVDFAEYTLHREKRR